MTCREHCVFDEPFPQYLIDHYGALETKNDLKATHSGMCHELRCTELGAAARYLLHFSPETQLVFKLDKKG